MAQELDPKVLKGQVRLYWSALVFMAAGLIVAGFGVGVILIGGHPLRGGFLSGLGLTGFFFGLTLQVGERYQLIPATAWGVCWVLTIVFAIYGILTPLF